MSDQEYKKAYEKLLKSNTELHAKVDDLNKRLEFSTKEASNRLMILTNMHNTAVEKIFQYLFEKKLIVQSSEDHQELSKRANYIKIQ